MKIENKEQLFAIMDGYSLDKTSDEEVEWQFKELSEHSYKHDMVRILFVFTDPTTLKIYRGSFLRSYEEGICEWEFPIECEEVEKYEKVVIDYRKVKT